MSYQEKPQSGQFLRVQVATTDVSVLQPGKMDRIVTEFLQTQVYICVTSLFWEIITEISSYLHSLIISKDGRKYSSQTIDTAMNM